MTLLDTRARTGAVARINPVAKLAASALIAVPLILTLDPVSAAVALENLDVFEEEKLLERVRENSPIFRATLEKLLDLPIVGDVRGDGYFFGIELVKDKATKETFDDDESERLLRGFLSKALFDAGLYCRADDRGDPVIQLAPPLTIGPAEFAEIGGILRSVLKDASSKI